MSKTTNETMKTILDRRSIRAYTGEQIGDTELEAVLEAGRYAPSAMNRQPWHFTVVQNKELLERIDEGCKETMRHLSPAFEERIKAPGFSAFYHAPTLIIVSGDAKTGMPQNDCTLAMSNMLLAAESLGLGSCWIHAVQILLSDTGDTALRDELGIPTGYVPYATGAFGHKAAGTPAAPPRKEGTVNFLR